MPWVGGLAEEHRRGTSVGPLVGTALREQFERLRDGDRFYWTRDAGLKTSTVRRVINLRSITLSKIIEANTDLTNLPRNVFTTQRVRPASFKKRKQENQPGSPGPFPEKPEQGNPIRRGRN